MQKYIITIMSLFLGLSVQAKTEAEFKAEADAIRKNQYTLSFNKFINPDCRVVVFSNKTNEHFIVKKFKTNSIPDFKTYIEDQDVNLQNESEVYLFTSVLSGKTRKYSYYIEKKDLVIRYELLSEINEKYSSVESILFENITCE